MSDIKITAHIEPNRPDACRLAVESSLYEGSARFKSASEAHDSPLAEALFRIPGIRSVKIAGSDVTLIKQDAENWRPVAKQAADLIREHLASGRPAVSPGYRPSRMSDGDLRSRVQEILDMEVNPAIASHGGMVDLLDVRDGSLYLRMGGGCQGCGMASATLRQGIEASLRQRLPDIEEILDVTDHASGTNPYYAPHGPHGH